MSDVVEKQTAKSFIMNVLNGLALGTVIVLYQEQSLEN